MFNISATTKCAGLDLSNSLIETFKHNNILTKEKLPTLITLTASTNEVQFESTFDRVVKHFKDKIELFDDSTLECIGEKLIKNILSIDYNENVFKSRRNKSLNIIKYIFVDRGKNVDKMIKIFVKYFDQESDDKIVFAKAMSVLAKMRVVFEFDLDLRRNVVRLQEFGILRGALKWAQTFYSSRVNDIQSYFLFASILDVLTQYADVFLEFKYLVCMSNYTVI